MGTQRTNDGIAFGKGKVYFMAIVKKYGRIFNIYVFS